MKRNFLSLLSLLMLMLAFSSCKKDDNGSGLKAVFSYVADGYKVNFTNFSSSAQTYMWEFGDGSGETSTSRSPQHVFTSKGDFLVSLTATNGTETSTFIDTVSVIGPNIRIDGDFSDWQYVPYTYENSDSFPGTVRKVKAFASSSDIYFQIEGTMDMELALIDMYIDGDNNPATGFSTFLYPAGSGADFLLEGPATSPSWGAVYAHSGDPTAFSFSPVANFDDACQFSALSTVSGKKVIEFSIKKSTLTATNHFVNFAFIELTSGYADLGKIPESDTPESKFIAVPL